VHEKRLVETVPSTEVISSVWPETGAVLRVRATALYCAATPAAAPI